MNIQKGDVIAGFPAITIRDLFRRYRNLNFNLHIATKRLGLDEARAQKFMDELEALGFIKKTKYENNGLTLYETTVAGNALALASAAKPVSRTSAEKRIAE